MKTTRTIGTLMLLLLWSVTWKVHAQGCSDPTCIADTLNISTGFNHNTSSYLSPLAMEPNWELVSWPTSVNMGTNPPSWVITPNGAWDTFALAKWVSPFQNSLYSVNNWPPPANLPFVFQQCFCMCQTTTVRIKFDMLVDDAAFIYLDNILVGSGTAGYQFQMANRIQVDTTLTLAAGTHCMKVNLHNGGAVAMGFSLEGYVTGANLLKATCCNPYGKICGTKVHDPNCSGAINPATQGGLSGWIIYLRDNLGNIIDTATTDGQGNYCFTGLAPGNYTVEEGGQSGWVQTYPSVPGTHSVNVNPTEVIGATFGNCIDSVNKCGFYVSIDFQQSNCVFSFQPQISGLTPPTQILSYQWTFGDGQSSNAMNPTHAYADTGYYTVCLTVLSTDGHSCCVTQFCVNIRVSARCTDPCSIGAQVTGYFDPVTCEYHYDYMYGSNYPVTSVLWNFGNGHTTMQDTGTYIYPDTGTYNICVTLFAESPLGCCTYESCWPTYISCSPCITGPSPLKQHKVPVRQPAQAPGSDKHSKLPEHVTPGNNTVVLLNQNSPNPVMASTIIHYRVPQPFRKASIVFSTANGKTLKTYDITTSGEGKLMVYADDLSNGTYFYTLIIDGKTIATRNMTKY